MFADSYINYAFSIIFVPFAPFFLFFRYFFVRSVHPFLCFFSHYLPFNFPFFPKFTFFFYFFLFFFFFFFFLPPFFCKMTLDGNNVFLSTRLFFLQAQKIL